MNIEQLRLALAEVLAKAKAKADEWAGKESEMPSAVTDEIKAFIKEAEELKGKLEIAMALKSHTDYLEKGIGTRAAGAGMAASEEDESGPILGFKSFGEQLMSVAKAGTSGAIADPRLRAEEEKATGLSEGVPAEGGFLVQEDFAAELLKRTYIQGEILSRVTRFPISANSNRLRVNTLSESSRKAGSRWGGVLAYWKAEAYEKVKSKPTFGQLLLELNKLIGLCYATDELLEDAAALEGVINWAFQMEFTFQIEDAVINGTGAGQPLGILNAPCTIPVAAEGGQAADTVVTENIWNMWSRMWAPSRQNAIWFINQDLEPQLFSMYVAVGATGVPVYLPANGLAGSPYSTLMGRPVIPVEYCQTLGDLGDIILADLSQYWMIDKGGMQRASSIHVKFIEDETCFRFVYRTDGQPSWPAALTPFHGTVTVSPFVTLAAR